MTIDVLAEMYGAAACIDREDGGELWRQAAYAVSHAYYFGGLPADEPEREVWAVVQGTLELLARLDPGGEGTLGISPE